MSRQELLNDLIGVRKKIRNLESMGDWSEVFEDLIGHLRVSEAEIMRRLREVSWTQTN
jgi:hypothetical protein